VCVCVCVCVCLRVPACACVCLCWYSCVQQARAALRCTVYAKLLTVRTGVSKGGVVTIMGTDIARVTSLRWTLHTLWTAPIQIVVSISMVASIIGTAVVPAVVVAVLLAPLNWWTAHTFDTISDRMVKWTSKRMKQFTEVRGCNSVEFPMQHSTAQQTQSTNSCAVGRLSKGWLL